MIGRDRFERVKKEYGDCASWAVWAAEGERPKDGMGEISFFHEPTDKFLDTLNPEVVLVGLNISQRIKRPFANFHPDYPEAQDYKLRFALHGTEFWGGYLTDIIKDFAELVSGRMRTHLRNHPDFERENVAKFEDELAIVGSISPTLVALGADSHAILTRNLGGRFRILKAPHYSMYISKENYRLKFDELRSYM